MDISEHDIGSVIESIKMCNDIPDIFFDLSHYYNFNVYNGRLTLPNCESVGSIGITYKVQCVKNGLFTMLDELCTSFINFITHLLKPSHFMLIVLGPVEMHEQDSRCYTTFYYYIHHIKHD